MADESKFTHIGVTRETRRKVSLLASAQDTNIYELIAYLVDEDWKRAVKAGIVKNSMLEQKAHWVGQPAEAVK